MNKIEKNRDNTVGRVKAATIRPAEPRDLPQLIEMGREIFRRSGSGALMKFDERSFACAVETFLTGKTLGYVLVAELADRLVGMTAYVLFPSYFNVNITIAQEMWRHCKLDSENDEAALLDDLEAELEADARRRGADVFVSAATSQGGERVEGLAFQSRGYRLIEKVSLRRLSS